MFAPQHQPRSTVTTIAAMASPVPAHIGGVPDVKDASNLLSALWAGDETSDDMILSDIFASLPASATFMKPGADATTVFDFATAAAAVRTTTTRPERSRSGGEGELTLLQQRRSSVQNWGSDAGESDDVACILSLEHSPLLAGSALLFEDDMPPLLPFHDVGQTAESMMATTPPPLSASSYTSSTSTASASASASFSPSPSFTMSTRLSTGLTIDTSAAPAPTAAWLNHLQRSATVRRAQTSAEYAAAAKTIRQRRNVHAAKQLSTARPGTTTSGYSTMRGPLSGSPTLNGAFACTWCPKKFATSGHLKQHVRTHTGDRPFPCGWCDKAFAQCGDLKRHERIHTGEKPFQCKTCGKAFAQCGNLKKHERIHAREALAKGITPAPSATDATVSPRATGGRKSNRAGNKASTLAAYAAAKQDVVAIEKTVAASAIATASKKSAAAAAAAAAAAEGGNGSDDSGNGDTVTRAERSRRTARECRQRKKQYIGELESKLVLMETRDLSLRDELEAAQRKLATLQAQQTEMLGGRK